jgi:hypothetical protein
MSTSLMVSMLRKGRTGDEIIKILETLSISDQDGVESEGPQPTDQWIEF